MIKIYLKNRNILFAQCEKIVFIDLPKYYYVQRNGSITRSKFLYKQFDKMYDFEEISDFILKMSYEDLYQSIEFRLLKIRYLLVYEMIKYNLYEDDKSFDEECISLIKEIRHKYIYFFSKI